MKDTRADRIDKLAEKKMKQLGITPPLRKNFDSESAYQLAWRRWGLSKSRVKGQNQQRKAIRMSMFVNGNPTMISAHKVEEEYLLKKLSDEDWDKILNDPEYTFWFNTKTNSIEAITVLESQKRLASMDKPHKLRGTKERVDNFLYRERLRAKRELSRLNTSSHNEYEDDEDND